MNCEGFMKLHIPLLSVIIAISISHSALAITLDQARQLADKSAQEQGLPADVRSSAVEETATIVASLPAWAPLYPNAGLSVMGNGHEKNAAENTESFMLNFQTPDNRGKVADFYAKFFAGKGEVTELRNENPWTIEVISKDQTETMTLTLEETDQGGSAAMLNYNKAPASR